LYDRHVRSKGRIHFDPLQATHESCFGRAELPRIEFWTIEA
jgi:hypothetical protein